MVCDARGLAQQHCTCILKACSTMDCTQEDVSTTDSCVKSASPNVRFRLRLHYIRLIMAFSWVAAAAVLSAFGARTAHRLVESDYQGIQ